jgi:integrase
VVRRRCARGDPWDGPAALVRRVAAQQQTGDGLGALFLPIRRGGHIKAWQFTTQAVYHILQKRAEQAEVRELSPHDFRRTLVCDLLDAGAKVSTVGLDLCFGHYMLSAPSRCALGADERYLDKRRNRPRDGDSSRMAQTTTVTY